MKRFVLAGLTVVGVWSWLATEPAAAQGVGQRPQTPFARPTTSPYLNLARGGSSTVNYFGLVRPQQDTTRALQSLQQQGQSVPQASLGADEAVGPMFVTGHATHFSNFGHYFPLAPGRTALPNSTVLGRR